MSCTMQDFITGEIAVTFKNAVERDAFLKECGKAGLRWNGRGVGEKATAFMPRIESAIRFATALGKDRLVYAPQDWHNDLGYTVVPFTSFNFAPRQELHITSDGLTTHAVCKVDGKIVGRGKATCSPLDEYDFKTGAWLAMARVFDKPVPEKPAKVEPKYREVKRAAKAGEKIKLTVAYYSFNKIGDILTVSGSNVCAVSVLKCNHPSHIDLNYSKTNLLPYPPNTYVVLEEIK